MCCLKENIIIIIINIFFELTLELNTSESIKFDYKKSGYEKKINATAWHH